MYTRAHGRVLWLAVSGVVLLSHGVPTSGQQSHGGTQVALVAWMPDSVTVRWPSGFTKGPVTGVSLQRGLNLRFGGRLLPGASLAAACKVGSQVRDVAEHRAIAMIHAAENPSGVLACDGAFRTILEKPETGFLDTHLVGIRIQESTSAARIDITLSAI